MLPTRLVFRLARRLSAAWAARDPLPGRDWRSFDAAAARVARLRRLAGLARERGWHLAADRHAAELAARLGDLARAAAAAAAAPAPPPPPPVAADWAREVRQLEEEFGGVEVRWAESAFRVTTGPVVLEGIDLGPFALDLAWNRAASERAARCFDVVALDPNPAAGRAEVAHPHVEGGTLCAGEAAGPLDAALAGGRLADAFLLVRAVLSTYNPASPYVPLSEWSGTPCGDCGRRADRDDLYTCGGCEADLCEGCAGACGHCCATRCDGCKEPCDVCRAGCCPGCLEAVDGRAVCPDCRTTCGGCGARVPKDDLTAGATVCPGCTDDEEDADDDADEPAVAARPGGTD